MATNITVENQRIEPFKGKNFSNWSFRVKLILEGNELDEFLLEPAQENDAAWKKKDAKCRSLIVTFISDDYLELVKDCKSAREMWRKLKDKYEKRHVGNRLALRKKLLTLKYDETTDLQNFFLEFDKLVRSLKELGATLSEEELLIQLLLSMPESYNNVIAIIENLPIEELNLEIVRNLLSSEERIGKEKGSKKGTKSLEGNTKTCYNCFRSGHIRRNCTAPPLNQNDVTGEESELHKNDGKHHEENERKEGVNEKREQVEDKKREQVENQKREQVENKKREQVKKRGKDLREFLISSLASEDLSCSVCNKIIHEESPVWNCSKCYIMLHLKCTTKWAKSSKTDLGWRCPNCQNVTSTVPYEYYCFCGKTIDPELDCGEWPHCCDDICGKAQKKSCSHLCLLPCHPGPCSPCTVTITKACGCQRKRKAIKCCSDEVVLCNNKCRKKLNCSVHSCHRKCHVGPCDKCKICF